MPGSFRSARPFVVLRRDLRYSPLERLFRDGATAPIQFPPGDFCLGAAGVLELGLNIAEMLPPPEATLKSGRRDLAEAAASLKEIPAIAPGKSG